MKPLFLIACLNGTKIFRAAALCAAIFFASTPSPSHAQYNDEIDIAVEAFAAAGTLAGVSIGTTEKSLIKGAAGCVANNRSFVDCARDQLVNQLPPEVRPMAQCLTQDLGNVDRNIGKCALQAAAPQLSKQLPPEVFRCLSENLNDMGKCAVNSAVRAATEKALANLPPEARQVAECVAKVSAQNCGQLGGPIKDAIAAAEKLKNASGTVANIIKVAEGIKNDDWVQVSAYGGVEVYKAAVKIVLNVLLTPALAPLIGPIVDAMVDSRVEIVTALIKALKENDHARIAQIVTEFWMTEHIRYACALVPKGDVREATCGNIMKAISALGKIAYGIVNCEALKGRNIAAAFYQATCGLAGDAAGLAFDAAKTVFTGVSEAAEFVGNIAGDAAKGVGEAFDAVKNCELGGIISDACGVVKDAVGIGGDVAEVLLGAPASLFESIFGGDDPPTMNDDACRQYAQNAVAQANQNQQRGCNLSGPRWSGDYNTHFNWCRGQRVSTANGEANVRGITLNQCRCNDYQQKTDAQIARASQNSCAGELQKRIGARWAAGRGHYDWCMRVGANETNSELREREINLNHCNFCQEYRRRTEEQVRASVANGCQEVLGGGRWDPDGGTHLNWCLVVSAEQANTELRERNVNLNQCGFCNGYQRATDSQIETARKIGCLAQYQAGMPNRWGTGRGHFNWCVTVPQGSASVELGARAAQLAQCKPPAPPPPPPAPGVVVPPPAPLPAAQTGVQCPDGSRAANFNQCPKHCPDGRVVLMSQQCPATPQPGPTGVQCPDGSRAANFAVCPKRCPDGRVVLMSQQCPPTTKTCPGGAVVAIHQQCPPTTKTCPGGRVVAIHQQCPPTTKTCPGGAVVAINAQCPPTTKTCPGGRVVSINQACPPTTKTCPNGAVVPITAQCPPPPPQNCRMEPDFSACGLASPGSKPCNPPMRKVCGPAGGTTGVR